MLWDKKPALVGYSAGESFLLNQKIYEIPDRQYKETLQEMLSLLDVEDKNKHTGEETISWRKNEDGNYCSIITSPKIVFQMNLRLV